MKVSIVIPWYNTEELVKKNLPYVLAAANSPANNVIEVIVVDDASPDKSGDIIKKEYSQVKVVQHKVNRGLSATVNTGVRSAKGELICLLDSDVVPEKNFLQSAATYFKSPNLFGVSLNERGTAGWVRGYFKDGEIHYELKEKIDSAHLTFWVSGCSGLFRRKVWMDLGGFDEKLFSPYFWEDVDLSYRAAKRGYRCLWIPDAKVDHEHGMTMCQLPKKLIEKVDQRNHLLFMWKNLTSRTLFRKHLTGLFRKLVKHPTYLRIVLAALSKLGPVIRARRKETKHSKISDEAVLSRFFQNV